MSEYRIVDELGVLCAAVEGDEQSALREIMHYAMMYGQVTIERKEGRKWRLVSWEEMTKRSEDE